jgi:hypothetical protein
MGENWIIRTRMNIGKRQFRKYVGCSTGIGNYVPLKRGMGGGNSLPEATITTFSSLLFIINFSFNFSYSSSAGTNSPPKFDFFIPIFSNLCAFALLILIPS